MLMMSHAGMSLKVLGLNSLVRLQPHAAQPELGVFQCRDANLAISVDLEDAVGGKASSRLDTHNGQLP
jgi:hypothetical protein